MTRPLAMRGGGRPFWAFADQLVKSHEIVIDRPVGSLHPRYADMTYPLNYGHLVGTRGSDGAEVDIWRGSQPDLIVTGYIVTVDLAKGDGELKLLVGCSADEMLVALATHNQGDAAGMLVRRPEITWSPRDGSFPMHSDRVRAAVVAYIAATRYPFPNQADWPADYQTIINLPERRHAVETIEDTLYPEIVILDGEGQVREGGVVVSSVEPSMAKEWAALAPVFDNRTETGVQHFFVYVPEGEEDAARDLLQQHGISYAGLRTYRVDDDTVTITPVETPAGPKDHR